MGILFYHCDSSVGKSKFIFIFFQELHILFPDYFLYWIRNLNSPIKTISLNMRNCFINTHVIYSNWFNEIQWDLLRQCATLYNIKDSLNLIILILNLLFIEEVVLRYTILGGIIIDPYFYFPLSINKYFGLIYYKGRI